MTINEDYGTIILDGNETEIRFFQDYDYIWIENTSNSSILVSKFPNIDTQTTEVLQRPAKSVIGMRSPVVYIKGSGSINVIASDSADNPFRLGGDISGGGSGSSGTTDYNELSNKPSINGVTLSGNKTLADFGLREMTDEEVINLINNAKGE